MQKHGSVYTLRINLLNVTNRTIFTQIFVGHDLVYATIIANISPR